MLGKTFGIEEQFPGCALQAKGQTGDFIERGHLTEAIAVTGSCSPRDEKEEFDCVLQAPTGEYGVDECLTA
jgi:hypothetical protein